MHRSQVLLSCSHVECTVEVTRQRFKDGETQHARAGGNERDGSFAFCHFHLGHARERDCPFVALLFSFALTLVRSILLLHLASPSHYHRLLNHSPTPARR
jgi:hypothetical protein